MISIHQYLLSITNSQGLTRTLGQIMPCRDSAGEPLYSTGNSAIVFRIQHQGKLCALRCYTHQPHNLEAIYAEQLLRNELFIYTDPTHGQWVDVVLCDWVEGQTLHEHITQASTEELGDLSRTFDMLALELVSDDQAHGDLKPDNIIVRHDGTMQPIDLDATFLPIFEGESSPELGTAAFQHPSRTASDFDARLDDFSVTLISTALHALALDPTLGERHGVSETLLIDPQMLPHCKALNEILALFERNGMALQYRIARLLISPTLRLPTLKPLLQHAVGRKTTISPEQSDSLELELFALDGLWGFREYHTQRIVIPAIYDCGFDFSEGLAAVQLGRTWHFIDCQGHTKISCPEFESVKPFRNGRAQAMRMGLRYEIDPAGVANLLEY